MNIRMKMAMIRTLFQLKLSRVIQRRIHTYTHTHQATDVSAFSHGLAAFNYIYNVDTLLSAYHWIIIQFEECFPFIVLCFCLPSEWMSVENEK